MTFFSLEKLAKRAVYWIKGQFFEFINTFYTEKGEKSGQADCSQFNVVKELDKFCRLIQKKTEWFYQKQKPGLNTQILSISTENSYRIHDTGEKGYIFYYVKFYTLMKHCAL